MHLGPAAVPHPPRRSTLPQRVGRGPACSEKATRGLGIPGGALEAALPWGRPVYTKQKLRIVTLGFRVRIARGRFATPISLLTIVARTRMYTYAAKAWELSSFKGHFLSRRAKP
jgi:hypothetical protein